MSLATLGILALLTIGMGGYLYAKRKARETALLKQGELRGSLRVYQEELANVGKETIRETIEYKEIKEAYDAKYRRNRAKLTPRPKPPTDKS